MGKMDEDIKIVNEMALGFASQGKYEEAIKSFKKSLGIMPNGQTYYLLGLTYQRLKNYPDAEKSFKQALLMNPQMPQPHNGLGMIDFEKGLYLSAIKHYKLALKYNPYDFAAYNNLGNAYTRLNKKDKAIEAYKMVMKITPQRPEPYNNLGTLYFQIEDFKKSEKYLEKAINVDPNYAMAYFHLGVLNRRLNKLDRAVEYLLKYNTFNSNHTETYRILGVCYLDKGDFVKAKENIEKAYQMDPKSAYVNNDLGNLFRKKHDNLQAFKYYKKALDLNPNFAGAISNLGILTEDLKLLKKATLIDPKCYEAYYHQGLLLEKLGRNKDAKIAYKKALKVNPDFKDAVPALISRLMSECDWEGAFVYEKKLEVLKGLEPVLLNVARVMNEKENLEIAKKWSQNMLNLGKSSGIEFSHKHQGTKIKIGYLSCDFYNHATSHLIQGIFKRQNRSKFEIFVYSYGIDDKSSYRRKIEKDSDHFVDISSFSTVEAAKKINEDNIDILVDLKGHTRDSRFEIMALKPAPIQVSWLGFPGSSGASFIDYIITDKVVTPSMKYYSEKPIYLPCYQVNDSDQSIFDKKYSRKDFELPEGSVIFASFNATYKITKETFTSWMNILKKVPNSVLWIYAPDKETQENLRKAAVVAGCDPSRLIFTGNLPKVKHLARIKLADISLDTFTYNGHTTTSDSLYAGVPVVTLKGKHFASRVSASLLTAIGLPELITSSQKEYEDLAIELAKNPKKLATINKSLFLNRKSSSLFNTDLFVKNLEKEYVRIWKQNKK